jgi:hypothetical protein
MAEASMKMATGVFMAMVAEGWESRRKEGGRYGWCEVAEFHSSARMRSLSDMLEDLKS